MKITQVYKRLKLKKVILISFSTLLFFFIILNIVAINHAYKLTHFSIDTPKKNSYFKDSSIISKFETLLFGLPITKPQNRPLDLDFIEIDTIQAKVNLEIWKLDMEPSKGVIALFHGYHASKSSLWQEALAFYRMGFTVVLVDFRASGNSEGNICSIGFYEAEDVQNTLKWCRAEYPNQKVFLYGSSMGAAAIMRAISELKSTPDAIMLQSPFSTMLSATQTRFKLSGIPSFPSAHLLTFWGGYLNNFDGFSHNPNDYAKNINCPTLLIHGQLDDRVSWNDIKLVFNKLNGPKELATFGKSGHESILNKEEANWVYLVTNFMEIHNQ
jgi:alpha-beta hydrolase superfamily lysophospholipase